MKLVCVSDPHLSWKQPVSRLDNALEAQLAKLEFILGWAQKNEAHVVIAGDVFNEPRSWYLLPQVISLLKKYCDVEVLAIFGQHDTYLYSTATRDATSLGCLAKAGLVSILDEDTVRVFNCGENGLWYLFGVNYGGEVPEPVAGESNILVIHAPIAEEALFPKHEYLDAATFLEEHKFDLILCGDIHRRFRIASKFGDRIILNPGPMFRRTADSYNMTLKPGFFAISLSEENKSPIAIDFVEIPHVPSTKVLTREHLDKAQHTTEMLEEFVGSLSAEGNSDNSSTDLVANIFKFIEDNNIEQEVVDLLSQVMEENS